MFYKIHENGMGVITLQRQILLAQYWLAFWKLKAHNLTIGFLSYHLFGERSNSKAIQHRSWSPSSFIITQHSQVAVHHLQINFYLEISNVYFVFLYPHK